LPFLPEKPEDAMTQTCDRCHSEGECHVVDGIRTQDPPPKPGAPKPAWRPFVACCQPRGAHWFPPSSNDLSAKEEAILDLLST